MDDEDKYRRYANIPIPSYEEAVSRPTSSQNHRGPQEVSDDAERQGLLGQSHQPQNNAAYRPPTVESARSSVDSDLQLPEVTAHHDDEERRQIEELDYLDPSAPDPSQPGLYHRARLRSKFAQRLSSLGATLSSLRLPSFRSFYTPVAPEADAAEEQPTPPPSPATFLTRLTQRLPTIPPRFRISAPNAARVFGLLTLLLLIYFLLIADIFPGSNPRNFAPQFDPEAVRGFVQERVDPSRIEQYLAHITQYDHVAGTEGDLFMAEWMRKQWLELGGFDDTAVLPYFVYLNYPTRGGRAVAIVGGPEDKRWTAALEEDTLDPQRQQTLAWHGYSKSGEAEGHLVYANAGARADFAWLQAQGVALEGCIALVRTYGVPEDAAVKVRNAQDFGCAGVLIYSDPVDDGSRRGPVAPEGPWRPDDSLQRDSVGVTGRVIGDPLTPGWASLKDARVVDRESSPALAKIPSIPLAWRDAKVLLASIFEIGVKVPENWVGGDEEFPKQWFSGASPSADGNAPIVQLRNLNDENSKQQIWNVHGLIQGVESPEKKVLIGNHHDAWCFGSVSPGSGSAVMMEVVEIFGQLRSHGWRPLRTIEFVSWDATEYNMVGSTEYVEDKVDDLRANGIAYLNVDTGVYGPGSIFRAAGSPVWERPLLHVLDRVGDLNGNGSLRQLWDQHNSEFQVLGTESDYVAFQDIAGTSSIDIGFEGPTHGYPRHSCYETFDWMSRFGDPGFEYSRTLAQIWALLILEIADRPIIPYDVSTYAQKIQGPYIDSLQQYAELMFQGRDATDGASDLQAAGFNLDPLREAGAFLAAQAEEFNKFENIWTANVMANGGYESTKWMVYRLNYNDALTRFDSRLLDLSDDHNDGDDLEHGVPGRSQFKHVIYGPQSGEGQGKEVFPFVRQLLAERDWAGAQTMVEKTAAKIRDAALGLTFE